MVGGAVAAAAAWALVAARRATVLGLVAPVSLALGATSVAVGDVSVGPDVPRELAVGLASGIALFAATRAVVAVAARAEPIRRQVEETYAQGGGGRSTMAWSLLASAGEELFWRGLFLPRLGPGAAAVAATTVAYVAANAPSRRLPIVAGALVGGALWGALAVVGGGVLAPLASHMLWTGLMLALPPGAGRRDA